MHKIDMKTKLKFTGTPEELRSVMGMNHKDHYFRFNKVRHELTNYEDLVPEYNETNDYMLLCNQVISLLGPLMGSDYKGVMKRYYKTKKKMNS